MISKFNSLVYCLSNNFKHAQYDTISNYSIELNERTQKALNFLKSGVIRMEVGSYYTLSQLTEFSFYKDKKYRAKINNELIEISENDFLIIQLIKTI